MGHAQARCGDAIDNQRDRKAACLLVCGHIGKLGQCLPSVDELCGPEIQLVGIGIFERVLVLGAADAVVDGDVLHGFHEELDVVHLLELSAICE